VYEMFFAVTNGVIVRVAPHVTTILLQLGNVLEDVCVNKAKSRVKSTDARCGTLKTR